MQNPQHQNRNTQNLIGFLGTVVVFCTIVSAPQWLQSVETPASSFSQPNRVESVMVENTTAVSLASVETSQSGGGAGHYTQFCAACHGSPGSERVPGLAGSDLFDGVSEQPYTPDSIRLVLRQGILEKGMIPMEAVLTEAQLEALVDYVLENQPS